MPLKTAGYLLGGILLTVALANYANLANRQRDQNVTPLNVPVSLAPGSLSAFDLPVSATRRYDIVIQAKTADLLKGEDSKPDIEWRLSEAGSLVSEGNSRNQPGADWWGTYEQQLGRFIGQAGHQYRLELDEKSVSASLASAHPILIVQIPRDDWEGYLAGEAIEKVVTVLVGALGVLIFAATFIVSQRLNKRNTLDHAASTVS